MRSSSICRTTMLLIAITASSACDNDSEIGAAIERVVTGDWASRFADDPTARLVSLPPGQSFFDAWVYQFGGSPSEWPSPNLECGPASVSMLGRLSGRDETDCHYRSSIAGCPAAVHSACRQTGVCGRSRGFVPDSGRGTNVFQMRDVLEGLGFTARVITGEGGDRMSLSQLRAAIDADHPMVVTVDVCAYRSELGLRVCSPSHFMVAYGYSDRYVYILDAGYRNGQRARISIGAFNRAIEPDPSGLEVTRPGFEGFPNATWYPPGSLLLAGGEYYYVVSPSADGAPRLQHASREALTVNHLSASRAMPVALAIVGCFENVGELDPTPHFREYRVSTGEVYMEDEANRLRYVFLNYAAYLSHGGSDDWRSARPSEIAAWSSYALTGTLGLAPGMLVMSDDSRSSAVYVVSYNESGRLRLPIYNAETARIYGYDVATIGSEPTRSARVPDRDLDLLAGPVGEMLRIELARDCRGAHCLTADACFTRSSPGGSDETVEEERESPFDSSGDAGVPSASSDAERSQPVVTDTDADGWPDASDCYPLNPSAHPGAIEVCDNVDNDCDGSVDEDGVCVPPVDPHGIRIRLSDEFLRRSPCSDGWVIRLWLAATPTESPPGGELIAESRATSGWSSITLMCSSNTPPWAAETVWEGGATRSFAELSLGGVDLRPTTMICIDPWAPDSERRPIIMWDATRRGSCPP